MKDFLHLCLLTSWFKISSPEKMSIICSDYTKTHLEIISSVIGNLGFEKIARFSLGQFPFEEGNEAHISAVLFIIDLNVMESFIIKLGKQIARNKHDGAKYEAVTICLI
jgi:hypothetical protein